VTDIQLNAASLTTGSTSGTDAPASRTSQTWTVVALSAAFPALAAGQTLSLIDAAGTSAEIIRVTACDGAGDTSITVTRGADGTTPTAHATGATFNVVIVQSYLDGVTQLLNGGAVANPAMRTIRSATVATWGLSTINLLGMSAVTAAGTATAATFSTANIHRSTRHVEYLVTTPATTAVAGWYHTNMALWRGNAAGLGGFKAAFRFGPATGALSTSRMFTGVTLNASAPTDVEPSSQTSVIGVGYDAADTQLYVMHNDGSGTCTKVATGLTRVNSDTLKVYTLTIYAAPFSSTVDVTITDDHAKQTFTTTLSTDLPTTTDQLQPRSWCSVGGVSSVIGMSFMGFYAESNY
jgi:hypothetical protein